MHYTTASAVRSLVSALSAHPEDLSTLAVYGDIPQHLLDLVEDYDLSDEEVN